MAQLLMRYVDDFLFITTSKAKAVKFVQAMHHGYPEYGCKISTEKCLANFDISVDGVTSVRSTVAKCACSLDSIHGILRLTLVLQHLPGVATASRWTISMSRARSRPARRHVSPRLS